MVKVLYNGRLGNQMLQYALGRIFAEELGFQLEAHPLPFLATKTDIQGKVFLDNGYYFKRNTCDYEHILNDKPQKQIVLDGYFQRSSYYLPFWDRIKSWYTFPINDLKKSNRALQKIDSCDIVLYIRLSDYVSVYKWALTAQFYHTVLEMATYRNVYIVTEVAEHPFLKEFEKYNPTYLMADPITQLFCGCLFDKIVMSCSTFAWWGAMLSDASEIYFPIDEDGIWCDSYRDKISSDKHLYRENLDLRVDDSRFIYFYRCPTVATYRSSAGLTNLEEQIPEATHFHKHSKAFCFL
jgi:hypothetical protein